MSAFLKKLLSAEHAGIMSELEKKAQVREMYVGDPALDWCIRGWHTAGINVIFGPAKSGKSALAYMAAAELQKKNPDHYVLIFDSEFALYGDRAAYERARQFGLNPDKVIVVAGNTIDTLFKDIATIEEDLSEKKLKICAIIIDSLGQIANPNAEKKIAKGEGEGASDSSRGNAKVLKPILNTFNRIGAFYSIPVFAVQHVIVNQEEYGDKYLLPGGENLKHVCQRVLCVEASQARDGRLFEGDVLFNKDKPKETDGLQQVGKKILGKCWKTRGGIEGGKVEFFINFAEARFAQPELSLFALASNLGIIYHPEGNNVWWAYNNLGKEVKAQGQKKMQELLAKDKDMFNRVKMDCRNSTKTSASSEKMTEVDTGAGSKAFDDEA